MGLIIKIQFTYFDNDTRKVIDQRGFHMCLIWLGQFNSATQDLRKFLYMNVLLISGIFSEQNFENDLSRNRVFDWNYCMILK